MPADQPKVTVLISTFNRPDYLREAIASVVNQRMGDWELLVMNDGGVDAAHVVEEFADKRIRYFPDTVNKGAAVRFNFGLAQARAEYVTYLGDDDLFYPNHLEVLSRALDEHPEVALTYSDLYAVSCVKDETTGKRFVLDKRIQVSRDFNRAFMFHYNHVLHVSLMHRKEAAFRVGGFDESVKVLIEWSLNRRLCFIYDFLHVPVVTGEYYMPVFKSDRISVVQRKDKGSYQHNLRKIRTNLPPEPWPKVDKLAVILPVIRWDESLRGRIEKLIDDLDHPFRLILVNNGTGKGEADCWAVLGRLAELKNITIRTAATRLKELEAYRFGAKKTNADYLLLVTDNIQVDKVPKRLFGGLEFLKQNQDCDGVKWDVEEEKKTVFDLLIRRNVFLKRSNRGRADSTVNIQTVTQLLPLGFKFDAAFSEVKKQFSQGNYQKAHEAVHIALGIGAGAPGLQYLVHNLVKICLKLKKLDEAERAVRSLIARGYEPDNQIRLGQIMQARGRFREAVEAYRIGLDNYGLNASVFESKVFPFNFPKELSAFNALIGQAESFFEMGDSAQAARHFRQAANLRANSHRPFLGFAKLFLAANQLDRAETSLYKIAERDGKNDPETHRVLGRLCERRGRVDQAFACYRKAFEVDKSNEKNLDPLYYAGASLGRWSEMKPVLEEFLEKRPAYVPAMARLASIHFQLGEVRPALDLAERGLAVDSSNAVLRSIQQRARELLAGQEMSLGQAFAFSFPTQIGIP
ncbi:MAG: glycosyltransferase [Thermodesulfobacteriota bacterium]